jgi:hypothetical protein
MKKLLIAAGFVALTSACVPVGPNYYTPASVPGIAMVITAMATGMATDGTMVVVASAAAALVAAATVAADVTTGAAAAHSERPSRQVTLARQPSEHRDPGGGKLDDAVGRGWERHPGYAEYDNCHENRERGIAHARLQNYSDAPVLNATKATHGEPQN